MVEMKNKIVEIIIQTHRTPTEQASDVLKLINKDVLDLLNRERSVLADLTRVKLTKTLNLEKIEIQKARIEILKELLNKTRDGNYR